MKIDIISQLPKDSMKGIQITAQRWMGFLSELGHDAAVLPACREGGCDAAIAIGVRENHVILSAMTAHHAARPLAILLSGSDLYGGGLQEAGSADLLERARRLVVLQPGALEVLPEAYRIKTRVIYQSAEKPKSPPEKRKRTFDVCVISHLREKKDPFRTALAARLLPKDSRIRIQHLGGVVDRHLKITAVQEMGRNNRYQWLGQKAAWEARRMLAESQLVVITSREEGGATVISEAVVSGIPVLASRIPGNVGLLGEDYPGYFPVGDTEALAGLMARVEGDADFRSALQAHIAALEERFSPETEKAALAELAADLNPDHR